MTPNWVSPRDGAASNYQNVWVYAKSPTTPYRSPDTRQAQARYLLLDPRVTDSDGRPGRDEWWFVIERNWPSDFDPYRHGAWGRLVNFHNVENDVGWDTGNGVSALALDWLAAPAPQFTLEYHDGGKPQYLPTPTRGTFHTYVAKFVAGRTERLRLRLLVTGVTYRHPGVLAKTVTTLDVLSGGRAELGIGAGWYEREHLGLGVGFPSTRERFERLEETLDICLQMWSDA